MDTITTLIVPVAALLPIMLGGRWLFRKMSSQRGPRRAVLEDGALVERYKLQRESRQAFSSNSKRQKPWSSRWRGSNAP